MNDGLINLNVWKRIRMFQDDMHTKDHNSSPEFPLDPIKQKYWGLAYVTALQMEVAELMDSFTWKPWRKELKIDKANMRREIVDCVYFLHHIARCFDISNEDLRDTFENVDRNNRRRYIEGDFSEEERNRPMEELVEEMKKLTQEMEKKV